MVFHDVALLTYAMTRRGRLYNHYAKYRNDTSPLLRSGTTKV